MRLAAQAVAIKEPPRRIRNTAKLLKDFQAQLESQGFELAWPRLTAR